MTTVPGLLLSPAVVPLVAVSGAECIEALSSAGFSPTTRTSEGTTLTRGLHLVLVPDVAMLGPDELGTILRTAGVAYSDFLDLLSDAPTEPAISRTQSSPSSR